MAEGSVSTETQGPLSVNTLGREVFGEGTLTRLFNEGTFLLSHLKPDISRRPSNRFFDFASRYVSMGLNVNPVEDLVLDGELGDGEDTVDVNWQATAKRLDIRPGEEDSWRLRTLTLHDVHIPETEETISVDFCEKAGMMDLNVPGGTRASLASIVGAVWEHFRNVRNYYTHAGEMEDEQDTESY